MDARLDTTAHAVGWWESHPTNPAWVAHYASSLGQPQRADVVGALRQLLPVASLFEVGCHCGPMLAAIQAAFPEMRCGGCDVNQQAAEMARRLWPGILCGSFPGVTARISDRVADVVLSCYTLAYTGPADLQAALAEMARLARVAVVLCEPMAWDGQTGIRRSRGMVEWQHPYLHCLCESPSYRGWMASCRGLCYDDNLLSGLIVAVRP